MVQVQVMLDRSIKSKNELFRVVSKKAADLNIVNKNNYLDVVNAFEKREKEFSTAIGDGFSIPHAVSKEIIEPSIFYIRTKSNVKWDDNNNVRYSIFLLIPESQRNSKHMDILSKIATSLLDEKFKHKLKTSKSEKVIDDMFKELQTNDSINEDNNEINNNQITKKSSKSGSKLILGITACPVGIAHTYIAAEKLKEAVEAKGYNCKVETHGSVGIKNKFTEKEIEEAELIIIASDISIDTSRFVGKKIYTTKVKQAVDNSDKVVNDAISNATLKTSQVNKNKENLEEQKEGKFVKHLMTGVSYMIPFIIFGGLLIALSLGLQKILYESTGGSAPNGSFLWYLLKFGEAAFGLMVPILGGFIAKSIAGRSAIAPAMIVSAIANTTYCIFPLPGIEAVQTPMGFIGAILFGVLIGHTIKWMNTWRIHKNISSLMPIFIIPLGVTLFYSLLVTFVIGSPIAFVMDKFGEAMKTLFSDTNNSNIGLRVGVGIGMGFVIGAMAGFDMGGPINKIAFITCSALLTTENPITNPMGMMAAAIPVAPIGMGLATIFYRKHFDKQQKSLGISAIIMGSIGISEGAIPFAIADPKRVFVSNIIGSAFAGAIAGAFGVTCAVAHGGPIVGILAAVSGNFIGNTPAMQLGLGITFFFIAIIIGSLITAFTYGLMLKLIKNDKKKEISNNGFKLKVNAVKNSISNTSCMIWIKNNKKLFAFCVMSVIASILLILGIVLTSIDGANIGSAITGVSVSSGSPQWTTSNGKFPIMGIYGLFGIVSGVIAWLFTGFYGFTVFKKKEYNIEQAA